MRDDQDCSVMDAGVQNPAVLRRQQNLSEAADLMVSRGLGRLPVVEDGSGRLCGLLSRRAILEVRAARLHSERR